MRLSNDPCSAACRLLFTAVMAFAWCGGPAAAAPDLSDPAELLRLIESTERNLQRDTFDPAAVVKQVGREPTKLFEWVRDNTSWVPYTGCLRGPAGVLMDRLGSNLDRAALLGELLRTAGVANVRLERGALSEEVAKKLAAATRPPPAASAVAGQPRAAPAAPDADTAQAEIQRMAADVAERSASLSESVRLAVAVAPGAAPDAAPAGARPAPQPPEPWKALVDHWWVRYDQDGAPVHLDPTPADARPGGKPVEASQSFELPDFASPGDGLPGAVPAANALPMALWHEVTLRVVVEQAKDGRLKESVALTRTLRPALLHGHRVVLHHFPLSPPPQAPAGPASTDVTSSLARYKATVLETREWYPMLEVAARLTGDASVTDAGELNPNPQIDAIKGTGKAVGKALADAFDVLSADPPAAATPPTSGGAFTAAWVEYEVLPAGRTPTKVRRQVFDLLGGAARGAARGTGDAVGGAGVRALVSEEQRLDRALALGGKTSLLVLGAQPSPQFVQHVMLGGIRSHADLLPEVARPVGQPMSSPPAQPLTERLNKISPPHGPLYGLALARHLWSPHRGRVYLDRPNVLSHHAFVRRGSAPGAGASELTACEAIDIAANMMAVRPDAGANVAEERRILAEQGVLDTVAETAFGGGCGISESAAGVLAAANQQNLKWVTLRAPRDPALAALDLPADDRARVEGDLDQGMTVVIPERPVRLDDHGQKGATAVAYWRIDPATGSALGIGRNGWGANMVERGGLAYYLITGAEAVKEIRFLACAIAVTALACSLACVAGGDLAGAETFYQVAKAAQKGCG